MLPKGTLRQLRWAAVRTRGYAAGESLRQTGKKPSEVYHGMVERGEVVVDARQVRLLEQLDGLHKEWRREPVVTEEGERLGSFNVLKTRIFESLAGGVKADVVAREVRGLYVHGDVGCGKTMLMDIFFYCLPTQRKLRIHLHAFMVQTYREVHKITAKVMAKELQGEIMDLYITSITRDYDVVCFDEFQCLDAADAALLAKMFQLLFEKGTLVVCTSNKAPDFFNSLGRQYKPFTALLESKVDVHHLASGFDYRKATGTRTPNVYIYPNTNDNCKRMLTLFREISKADVYTEHKIQNLGRAITVPYSAGGVALFTFEDLCGDAHPYSPADYNVLASQYHTIFLLSIPTLSVLRRNQARRFITLVDELYQFKVKLVCCAAAPIEKLFSYKTLEDASARASEYDSVSQDDARNTAWREDDSEQLMWRFTGEEDVFAFKRVESRLNEMSTHEYIKLPHLLFMIDDIDIGPLLGTSLPPADKQFIDI